MDQTAFDQLCRETCTVLGLPSPDVFRDEGIAEIDEVGMAVRFAPEEDEDAISFYVDLGLPAPEHQLEVWEQLLQVNLLHGTGTCAVYARDAESGHAVSCLRLQNADELDADFLAEMLKFYAAESIKARRMVENPSVWMFEDSQGSASSGGLSLNLA
ncbi:MAG: hypothetical protein EOO22_00655 [Comamonadaceae bacterium]|nr:MAG: hypothetical protein EOO22_00655 [Comamonadaceae bacterium]